MTKAYRQLILAQYGRLLAGEYVDMDQTERPEDLMVMQGDGRRDSAQEAGGLDASLTESAKPVGTVVGVSSTTGVPDAGAARFGPRAGSGRRGRLGRWRVLPCVGEGRRLSSG